MTTWWTPAYRADLGLRPGDLPGTAFTVTNRGWYVLYGLLAVNGLSLFLAFTTGSTAMVYFFGIAAIALVGYCYTLVQIRNQEYLRRHYGNHRAA